MKKNSKNPPKENPKKFKDLVSEIEKAVDLLESGEIDLEDGIEIYKNSLAVIQEAKSRLKQIEHEFEIIEN